MRSALIGLMLAAMSMGAQADQTAIPNYDQARDIFWDELYLGGGSTLYCVQPFRRKLGLEVEHVYPAGWMVDHLGCTSRRRCRSDNDRFNRMEGDLHNLFPARAGTNRARSTLSFGEVE